jgi:hypothetical protein
MFIRSKYALDEENKKLRDQIEELELKHKRQLELRDHDLKRADRETCVERAENYNLKKELEISRNYVNILLQRIAEIVGACEPNED